MGLSLGPSLCHFKSQWLLHVPPSVTVKILCSVHRIYFYILYGSQNEQRFPYAAVRSVFHNRVCLLRGTSLIFKYNSFYSWLRWLVAGFSPRRPRFDPSLVNVRVVVEKVTLGRGFLRVPRFSLSASFRLSSLLFSMLLLKEGQIALAWEPPKRNAFRKSENNG
jgi:hypothetical protein